MTAYPIDGIPSRNTSPSKPRIGICACFGTVPAQASQSVYLRKLRQTTDIRSPSEVINNKPLNTRCFGGVDEGGLESDACGSDNAYDSVLADKGLGQS